MSAPALSPPPVPSPSSEKRRFRLSGWLKGGNNKLTKEKPLPSPPAVPPERPGTPFREETFREVVAVSRTRPVGELGQSRKDDECDYRKGRDWAYDNGGGVWEEKEKSRAWEDPPVTSPKHGRSASHDPPRPLYNVTAHPNGYEYTSSPGLKPPAAPDPPPVRSARVFSAPPPPKDAYTSPERPWGPRSPPSAERRVPAVITTPVYGTSQTLRYALAGDGSPSPPGSGGMPMPMPMLPIPLSDAFSALSLNTPTPRSAPPDGLFAPPQGFAQSPSAVSLSPTPSPIRTPQRDGQKAPRTPLKQPGRRRSNSSPASPAIGAISTPTGSASAGSPASRQPKMTVQCAGITKAGLPCQRQVKALSALAYLSPDEPVERYCHQHAREVLEPSGFYTRPTTPGAAPRWVGFAEWIPPYLSQATQILLRTAMESPPSISDSPGHIYAYELRTPATEPVVLKVGRATNVKNRLGEWSRQCAKEVVLRGLWPPPEGFTVDPAGRDASPAPGPSLLRGRLKPGEKAPCSHRLERLIHLELADVSLYGTHLRADFLSSSFSRSSSPAKRSGTTTPTSKARSRTGSNASPVPASPASASKAKPAKRPLSPCEECGKLHKEIFMFDRVQKGRAKGREWEEVVWPVIKRWGEFVELVYGDDD